MFEAGFIMLMCGLLLLLIGAFTVSGDLEGLWMGASMVLIVSGFSLMVYGDVLEKREAGVKFRSMYEIASPCRLHDVDWCDGGECQVVIRCSEVKGVTE